ncbi:MAG: hypothetical protein IJZ90_01155 [Clostridia bacterium]|nr:hypothetical protein [Clostridia bacterium]
MKKYNICIKRSISLLLFVCVLAGCLWWMNRVLIPKRTDGITTMQNLYEQEENTIDVLLLGSSHSGMNFDTALLWENFGMSGYALWGSVQPFWNSYFSLKEALKTQSPTVVVLDTYAAAVAREHSDYPRQVTNVSGMKFSINKLEAICVSAYFDRWDDLLLGLPLYHQRYASLSENDFEHFPSSEGLINDKGSSYRYGSGDVGLVDVSEIEECGEIYEKQEKYLIKIIELCKENNLPLVLTASPTGKRTEEQPYYNSVAEIAESYGIEFINFNLMDEELKLVDEDYWTDNDHLNTNGSRKITQYLGEYLKSNYDIADRRGDARYSSWNINALNARQEYFKLITKTGDYFNEIKRYNLELVVVKNTDEAVSESVMTQLAQMGINVEEFNDSAQGVWKLKCVDGVYSAENYDVNENEAEYTSCSENGKVIFDGGNITVSGSADNSFESDKAIVFLAYDSECEEWYDYAVLTQGNSGSVKHIA